MGWSVLQQKNHGYAVRTYTASGGAASDAGKVAPETKLGKAMLMFDAMMNLTEGFGRELTGGRLKKAVSTDSAFFIQHAVEHQTSGVRMLALMDSYRGKLKDKDGNVIKNKDGKDANVFDVLIENENGALIVDPRVANFSVLSSRLNFVVYLRRQTRSRGVLISRTCSVRSLVSWRCCSVTISSHNCVRDLAMVMGIT